jgi:Tol biopolymer transport system component
LLPGHQRALIPIREIEIGSIYRIAADGSAPPEQLITGREQLFAPSWAPDGSAIAYGLLVVKDLKVATMQLPSASPDLIVNRDWLAPMRAPTWRHDSRQLLVEIRGDSAGIFAVARNSDGAWSVPHRITHGGTGRQFESPDGTRLPYFSGIIEASVLTYAQGRRRVAPSLARKPTIN